MGSLARGYRGFPRTVYVVAAARFLNVLGSGLVYPFATLYFYGEVGIAFTVVGAGLFANSIATAAGTTVGGYLADRYGRKPVMVTSMAVAAPALAAYATVRTGGAFVAVATLAGGATGLFAPASQAMVADVTASDGRERAYGLLKVASNAGFGTGFVAGGVLYGVAQTSVFVLDGATSAVVAAVLTVTLPATAPADGHGSPVSLADWRRAATRPAVLWVAALNVVFAVAYAQMGSTVPVFANESLGVGSERLGALFVLNPLLIVLFQLPVVDRVAGWRRTRGLALSAGFWGVSFLAIVAAHLTPRLVGVGLVAAFVVLRTVGEVLHAPLVTALASDLGTADGRGTRLSVVEVAKRVGFGVGPVVGGVFFDAGLAELLWPTLVVVCAGLAVAVLGLERRLPADANR